MIQKRSSAPKVRMAATIWFSVSEEKKRPMAMKAAPDQEEAQVAVEDGGELGVAVEEGEERQQAGQAEHGQPGRGARPGTCPRMIWPTEIGEV